MSLPAEVRGNGEPGCHHGSVQRRELFTSAADGCIRNGKVTGASKIDWERDASMAQTNLIEALLFFLYPAVDVDNTLHLRGSMAVATEDIHTKIFVRPFLFEHDATAFV